MTIYSEEYFVPDRHLKTLFYGVPLLQCNGCATGVLTLAANGRGFGTRW